MEKSWQFDKQKITAKYRCRATEEVCNKWMQCVALAKKNPWNAWNQIQYTNLPKITELDKTREINSWFITKSINFAENFQQRRNAMQCHTYQGRVGKKIL